MLESRQQGGDFGGGGGNVNKRWVEERAAERELLQQDISERMEKWRGGGDYIPGQPLRLRYYIG